MDDLKVFTLTSEAAYTQIKDEIESNEKVEQWLEDIAIYKRGSLSMIVITMNDELAALVENNNAKLAENADINAIKSGNIGELIFGSDDLLSWV